MLRIISYLKIYLLLVLVKNIQKYLLPMGGSDSKFEEIRKIDNNQWQTISTKPNLEIVKNRHNSKQGQIRLVPLNPKTPLKDELQTYLYRKQQNDALITCYGVEEAKGKSTGMCSSEKCAKVLTQRIPRKFSQLPQLTVDETAYALGEALRGYEALFKRMGSFDVTPNMLGINEEGKVKVWANQNFASNHPVTEKYVLGRTSPFQNENEKESMMVKNVLDLVEQRCENGNYPSDLKQRFRKNSDSFRKAKNQLNAYNRERRKVLPNFIHPESTKIFTKYEEGPITESKSRLSNFRNRMLPDSKPIIPITNSIYTAEPSQIAKYQSAPLVDTSKYVSKEEDYIIETNSSHRFEEPVPNIENSLHKYQKSPQPISIDNIRPKLQQPLRNQTKALINGMNNSKFSTTKKILTENLMNTSGLRLNEAKRSSQKSSDPSEPVGATRVVEFRNSSSTQGRSSFFHNNLQERKTPNKKTPFRHSSQPQRKTNIRFSYITPQKNQIRNSAGNRNL